MTIEIIVFYAIIAIIATIIASVVRKLCGSATVSFITALPIAVIISLCPNFTESGKAANDIKSRYKHLEEIVVTNEDTHGCITEHLCEELKKHNEIVENTEPTFWTKCMRFEKDKYMFDLNKHKTIAVPANGAEDNTNEQAITEIDGKRYKLIPVD